ncbi:hypothetical protein FOA52_008825 [Chlamydomonas sp. UWO 241]|nr:hypothetical protein FOA52_008825 [Chlamydomonas sp. UWO 241]
MRPMQRARMASPAAAGAAAAAAGAAAAPSPFRTLEEVLRDDPRATPELAACMLAVADAGKNMSRKIARAGIVGLYGMADGQGGGGGGADRDAQKKLDVVANDVVKAALAASGVVRVMASEEEDEPIVVGEGPHEGGLVAVFDPLDGSSNIEVSIPTGTIFGVYRSCGPDPSADCLQPGSRLLGAGYVLYSSACMLVLSLGCGVQGFTLDPDSRQFVLTHPDMACPQRGQIYSLNDARFHDWPAGLQRYIDDIRQGRGQNPKQYSSRYVCSLVADFHRTLLYGGWAANPREHLRLVYEANPLAFLAEQAGGKGSDGTHRILDIVPTAMHQRLPLFLGSSLDIEELEGYQDVQQLSGKKYDV